VLAYNEVDAEAAVRRGVDDHRLAVAAPCTAVMPDGGGPELRRRHGIEEALVLFIGARQPYKGLDLLLQAIGELSARGCPATLVVLGNGPPPDSRRAAGARVIDAGSVGDREKAAWLDAADVLVLPSSNESYGLVLAEAWSMGTPVVTSDIPVLAALVAESGGGLATRRDPAALAGALEELLGDPARARALGAAGRRYWAGHLTPQAAAGRLLRRYTELLDPA
jgi:glycosyltransferase involved in cell wall biosynthesis